MKRRQWNRPKPPPKLPRKWHTIASWASRCGSIWVHVIDLPEPGQPIDAFERRWWLIGTDTDSRRAYRFTTAHGAKCVARALYFANFKGWPFKDGQPAYLIATMGRWLRERTAAQESVIAAGSDRARAGAAG